MPTVTIQEAQTNLSDLIHRLTLRRGIGDYRERPAGGPTGADAAGSPGESPPTGHNEGYRALHGQPILMRRWRTSRNTCDGSPDQRAFLEFTLEHIERQAMLPLHHRDPFDRMLVAQAMIERLTLVSADAILDQYGIDRVW